MKRMKRYIFIAAAALLGAASCNKFVDLAPTTFYSESVVWNGSEANLDKYVYGLYAAVRDRSELYNSNMRDFTDAYSDLVKTCSYDQYGQSYNICLLEETTFTSAGASAFEIWSDSYSRIKRETSSFATLPPMHPNTATLSSGPAWPRSGSSGPCHISI